MASAIIVTLSVGALLAGSASVIMLVVPVTRSRSWATTCAFTIAGFSVFLIAGATGGMSADGVIHEPFFALIPLGYLCLLSSIVSGVLATGRSIRDGVARRERS